MYLTTQGLVLRVSPYNDTDAMLTLLTADAGKLSVKVRGLRRRNSPLSAPCQLLAYAQFTLFEYKGTYTVNEAHTLEIFSSLRKELTKLSLGTYFAQVTELIAQEDQPNPELLSLILNCLYALSSLDLNENQIKAVFELRAACLSGYFPDLSACHICGNPQPDLLVISEGHLECSSCRNHSFQGVRMPVAPGVLEALRYICYCEPKKMFGFSISPDSMQLLSQTTESYLLAQLERGFSTLDFYKQLVYCDGYSITGE